MESTYQPISDLVLLRIEKEANLVRPSGIILTNRWSEIDDHVVKQDGIVVAAPLKMKDKTPVQVQPGDHVYFHHHATNEANEVETGGEILYKQPQSEIYCKVKDGEVTMIGKWNLVEPLMDLEEGEEVVYDEETKTQMAKTKSGVITKAMVSHDTKRARLVHVSPELKESLDEVQSGDIVFYRKDCDYPIVVGGRQYFRNRKTA